MLAKHMPSQPLPIMAASNKQDRGVYLMVRKAANASFCMVVESAIIKASIVWPLLKTLTLYPELQALTSAEVRAS